MPEERGVRRDQDPPVALRSKGIQPQHLVLCWACRAQGAASAARVCHQPQPTPSRHSPPGWTSPHSSPTPSALSWSAQNALAKQGKPCIAAACCLRFASTASKGCQPLEARARAHREKNSVFPYVFSGPEADFGRWP
jgi:hypothetical protein